MSRVAKILNGARLALADTDKDRWDDATLLSHLNEGVKDFVLRTKMLTSVALVELAVGQQIITLPKDCWHVSRVLYNDKPLNLLSYSELDSKKHKWNKDEGEPSAFVYNLRNMQQARVYPALNSSKWGTESVREVYPDVIIDSFGTITYSSSSDIYPSLGIVSSKATLTGFLTLEELMMTGEYVEGYGITTSSVDPSKPKRLVGPFGVVVDDNSDLYGVGIAVEVVDTSSGITEIVGDTEEFSPFGCIVDINPSHLFVYYLKIPEEIIDIESEIATPELYDVALKFYVAGQAYLQDIESGSSQKGAQQLSMYENHVNMAKKDVQGHWMSAPLTYTTHYRRGV